MGYVGGVVYCFLVVCGVVYCVIFLCMIFVSCLISLGIVIIGRVKLIWLIFEFVRLKVSFRIFRFLFDVM